MVNTAWLAGMDNVRSVSAMVIINGFEFFLPILSKD